MASRIPIIKRHMPLLQIAEHHADVTAAIRLYYAYLFSDTNRFDQNKPDAFTQALHERIEEIEMTSSLSVFAALEARFRLDYLLRAEDRDDEIEPWANELIDLFDASEKQNLHADFKQILTIWLRYSDEQPTKDAIGYCLDALEYRNWLAHGRYWSVSEAKQSVLYDYDTLYAMADFLCETLPLHT